MLARIALERMQNLSPCHILSSIMPHILIIYNAPTLPEDHPDTAAERDVLHTVDAVEEYLLQAGYTVGRLGLGHEPSPLVNELKNNRPAVVFNLFEGIAILNQTEATVGG